MNKYIIELLRIQSSVILPGFGSLVITSRKTGKITFNALLKFNDGVLAKFISEKEGVDQQNAQNQIAKFVREIEAEIGKGISFDIFELGKFSKNEKGEIGFTQDEKSIASMQLEVAPKIDVKKTEKPVIEKAKEEPKKVEIKKEDLPKDKPKTETSLTDKLKASEEKKEIPNVVASENIEEKPKNSFNPSEVKKIESTESKTEIAKNIPVANASKKETPAQDKNVFKPSEIKEKVENVKVPISTGEYNKEEKKDKSQTANSQQSIKEKFKKDKPQKVKHKDPESDKKPKKKKKRTVLWIIIIIILGGGATAGYFYKDEINNFLHQGVGEHDSDSTQHNTVHKDSLKQDALVDENLQEQDSTLVENLEEPIEVIEEPVKEDVVKEKPVVNHNTGSSGSYHIIGNAFSSETNAENYVNKMKEKGYPAQNIGKHNGLYLVSLKSFSTKEEAKSNLSSVKADAEGAYVFTKK